MKKRDCMNCKNCKLMRMEHENGITNVCKFENRIANLTFEQLKERIENDTCDWFEAGKPETSNEIYYED